MDANIERDVAVDWPMVSPMVNIATQAAADVKVLIVDDEPGIANEISDYLTEKGFCSDVALDAEQAMERIFANPEIGLVFTDIRLPGSSGIEMVRQLRVDLPRERDLEFIFFSGYVGTDEAIGALRAGALDFLAKPIKLEELSEIAEHAIELVRARRADRSQGHDFELAREAEKKMFELQRKLVSSMVHEFRNPLTIIDVVAQRLILHKEKYGPEEVEQRSKIIRGAVARMSQLIEGNLCMSRLDAGKIHCKVQRCDLAEMVDEAVKRQIEISPERQFNVDTTNLSTPFLGDPSLMNTVFSNLLSNSEKYSPISSPITIKGWNQDGFAMMSVTDQGVGIPNDEIPQLFKRFFRARTSDGFPGTGIGLALIKEIVEMQGGGVEVESVEGEGSTFTIRLPIPASGHASTDSIQDRL